MSQHGADSSEVIQELRALTRKFVERELAPLVDADEREGRFRPEIIQGLGALGLTGIPMDPTYGGSGLGYQEYCAVIEEIARVNAGYAVSVAVTGLPQMILSNFGSNEQKEKYIPLLASGAAVGAFSLSEASSGSDAASLRTTAKREGDSYVIHGTKLWTTQGDSARVIVVMARTGEPGPKGISTFLIDREKEVAGFRLGKREHKMGLHTSHTMELVFDQCRIPASQRIGDEGNGFTIAMSALDSGRITIAATALGIASAALDLALSHARQREQFGQPIGAFQGIQFLLADRATELAAARLLVERAARLRDEGKPYSLEAAQAKLYATDMAMRVTTDAVQVLGGSGYTTEFPAERYMREAKVLQIVEGTNQIQRLVIGRALLGRLGEGSK